MCHFVHCATCTTGTPPIILFCRKIGNVVNELKVKFEPMLPWMIQWKSHHEEDSQWIAFECSNALFFNWLSSQIFGCFSFENNEILLLQWLHLLSSSSEVFFVATFLLGISSFLPFLSTGSN